MTKKRSNITWVALAFMVGVFCNTATYAAEGDIPVYDESAYTKYVEDTMNKLNKLYLEFCGTCNTEASKAAKARKEYYDTVRELLQHMNAKFDSLDPKKGAALSGTEVLVSMHVLTMLVDILTATQMEDLASHSHN
ncbi:MAG: hypothetical protein AMJ53_14880 [Gammaproteobacteria bacterium SG8_11]|nr:MAG: hypothetical protein AMJ53_14880 [Gammaproteobacteria bacterium SG8_11]